MVSMRNLNYRRIFAFTGLFSLSLVYIFLWARMIADPKTRNGSDFIGFYTYGRISQTRGFRYIHDMQEQKKIEEEVVGYETVPIFYTHLPFIAPLAAILVDEDYVSSFKRWAIVLLLLNALNVHLLVKMLEMNRFTKENLVILYMGAFLFFPTFSGFMNGQDTAILLLGAILWASGTLSKRYLLAGLGLSLTTVRPQIALILAIPFLFRHRNVFWGFAIGSLILAGISLALIKIDGAYKFIESIRYIENTIWHESHSFDMPTLSGIVRRNFEIIDPEPVKTAIWICYLLGIAGFCILWHKSREVTEKHIGLISLAAIFLLPYAHYHDLILLLIPIFCLIRILEKENILQPYYLSIIPLVVSLLAGLSFAGSGTMKFSIVYIIMFVLGTLLIAPEKMIRYIPRSST
jgi:hypothetical protein